MKNYSSYLLLIWCTLVLCSCSQVPTNLYPIYKNGKYGYIDSLGNEVIKPQYLYASYFNEGIALMLIPLVLYFPILSRVRRLHHLLIYYLNKRRLDTNMDISH